VSHSLAVGRRLARKAAMFQLAAGVLAATVAGLGWGAPQAAGALAGASAAALGTVGMARLALGGGIQPARVVYLRLLAGMLVKWLLVGVLLWLAMAQWRFPPLAVLAGLALAMGVFPLAHLSGAVGQRNRQGDE
jgi:ATP synthase protein I